MSKLTKETLTAIEEWDEFFKNQNRSAPINFNETHQEKLRRVAELEKNIEEWFKYYFAAYYTSEPAPFHKRSTKRFLNNDEWYEVRAWSRELSKSGRTMMEVIYLAMTGKIKNIILTSNSYDNAVRLLAPYKSILEKNERLIHDYGLQMKNGAWTEGEFITRKGVSFRAIGAGQSPRGTRNEAARPDCLIIDDFDTDEDVRNPEIIEKKWDWLERAFYATRSISNPLRVMFLGNIIGEDCCIKRAIKMADHFEIVNIRDDQGRSTWPQKNTEEMIDRVLSKISYRAAQGEYFNNPITEGKVFKELHYKKMRPIREYKFLIAYTDPSYKSSKKNDFKATALIGRWKDEYHVIRMYCAQTTTATMLDWQYAIMKDFAHIVPIYFYIEWPWIDDTLKDEIAKANKRHNITLPLRPDDRQKPEKFFRIESTLEPLNREGKLWFNEDLEGNEMMKEAEGQFTAISPTSRAHDDAPDAVEGAVSRHFLQVNSNSDDIEPIPIGNKTDKRL